MVPSEHQRDAWHFIGKDQEENVSDLAIVKHAVQLRTMAEKVTDGKI